MLKEIKEAEVSQLHSVVGLVNEDKRRRDDEWKLSHFQLVNDTPAPQILKCSYSLFSWWILPHIFPTLPQLLFFNWQSYPLHFHCNYILHSPPCMITLHYYTQLCVKLNLIRIPLLKSLHNHKNLPMVITISCRCPNFHTDSTIVVQVASPHTDVLLNYL